MPQEHSLRFRDLIWSDQPYSTTRERFQPSLTRSLYTYGVLLHFQPKLFENKVVLDFGCGRTNLAENLCRVGISAKAVLMVDADESLISINPDLIVSNGQNLVDILAGLTLPDVVLALASTYQIPEAEREHIFSQLLKIAQGSVHIAPIYVPDYEMLKKLADQEGFEIVACRQYAPSTRDVLLGKEEIFEPGLETDYDQFIDSHSEEERIIPPSGKAPVFTVRFGISNLNLRRGSNYIILRRRKNDPKGRGRLYLTNLK